MAYGAGIVALFSTIYTSAIPGLQAEFGVSKGIGLLGVTTYLSGMAAGAPNLAPLREMCGHRPVYLLTTVIFLVLIIQCGAGNQFCYNRGNPLLCRFLWCGPHDGLAGVGWRDCLGRASCIGWVRLVCWTA